MLSEKAIMLHDVEETKGCINYPSRGTLLHVCAMYLTHVPTAANYINIKVAVPNGHQELCAYLLSEGADPYLTYPASVVYVESRGHGCWTRFYITK